jgi:signal peptide peptidase SppA
MPRKIDRLLSSYGQRPWLIEESKGNQILDFLEICCTSGMMAAAIDGRERPTPSRAGSLAILPLFGTLVPRGDLLSDSSGATSLSRWSAKFRELAGNPDVSAIMLEIDSPGGQVDMVSETAAIIREARRADRPIVAMANNMAASAAYWIASAADEIVATPSAEVGSIGVFNVHQDISERLAKEGVRMTITRAGPRKAEVNPFEPLTDEAKAYLAERVTRAYDRFTADVALNRGVAVSVVRADPLEAAAHFGGGRSLYAEDGLRLGLIDRIERIDQTISRLSGTRSTPARRSRRQARLARRRLALG